MPTLNELWNECSLTEDPLKIKQLDYICGVALKNQDLYETVETKTFIPWPIIASIHFRESDQDFTRHIHNGDPLTERTTHVPVGRPNFGEPPFRWVDSAVDAFSFIRRPREWPIVACLDFIEHYNGLGYRHRGLNSPYLWNYTDRYTTGLYVEDGTFDPFKVESRPGCVSILKMLAKKGVSLDFSRLAALDRGLH